MSNVETELLARVGEGAVLLALMDADILHSGTEIPAVHVQIHDVEGDKDAAIIIDDEPRRLVYVPGFDWMWYNAEGPEE